MENQHRHIAGYRELNPTEIDMMNAVKRMAEKVGALVEDLDAAEGYAEVDKRWVAIARTELQQGFMALTRAIARPTTF